MGNPYPVEITDEQGESRLTGFADFTDPSNQPGGGSQPINRVTVPISSAQILALDTPVEIVPAPAAGLTIAPVSAQFAYIFNTTPYTVGGSQLSLFLGDPSLAVSPMAVNIAEIGFYDQPASQFAYLGPANAVVQPTRTPLDGVPLVLCLGTGGAILPTDGDGTLKITVTYVLAPVA